MLVPSIVDKKTTDFPIEMQVNQLSDLIVRRLLSNTCIVAGDERTDALLCREYLSFCSGRFPCV